MATAPEDIREGGDPNPDPNADPNPNPDPNDGGDPEGNEGDSPYAELAQRMGWVPKDQFDGPPEAWKPADQFILDGRDIQRETSRELKSVRQQLDTIAKTSASIVEQQVQERVQELAHAHQKAVADDEPEKAFKIASEITKLTSKSQGADGPSPDARSFAEKHSSWFQKDPLATALAIEVTNKLAAQGYDQQTQLRYAEQEVRRQYPNLFGQQQQQRNGKAPAGVNAPSGRTSGGGNRQQGFTDLPPEAQKIARDMEERGVIKSKDDYAKNYFANLKAKG